jgi:glutathione S-transferase
MKLYTTEYSPYARMARIVVREKNLQDRVEEVQAQTRTPNSPYYAINPSGRVPYLVGEGGVGMEGSRLICTYLDHLDKAPAFVSPTGAERWEAMRLEALARSLMDGILVWFRELLRPKEDRSSTIIEHEIERTRRLIKCWESEISSPLMCGPLNYPQLTLACALQLEIWKPEFTWRSLSPKLVSWLDLIADRPAFAATRPPGETT